MKVGSIGDMAQLYSKQMRNTALKTDIQRLTLELASGKTSDIREAMSRNTAYIIDIEHSLKQMDGYALASREAAQFATGIQNALTRVNDISEGFRDSLLTFSVIPTSEGSNSISVQAAGSLDDIINALNSNVAGRSLFAGTATDQAALVEPEVLLSGLTAAIGSSATVDDLIDAASAWFDDPLGFGAMGYLGSVRNVAPMAISESDFAQFDTRGDDPALRNVLKNIALVALADNPTLGLTDTQKEELFKKITPESLQLSEGIIRLQENVGSTEGRIEASIVRQNSMRSAFEMARNDFLSIDPYKTATELEQVQFQLQSLYAITSRMSQLSLVNFL